MALLPDRERRHLLQFHLAKRLAYGPRLLLALALIAAGIAAQLALYPPALVPALLAGGLLLLAGTSFLLLRGHDLSPGGRLRGAAWERTTLDRFREVMDLERKVSRWDSAMVDISCPAGFFALLGFVALPVGVAILLLLGRPDGRDLAVLVGADAGLLLLPHWLFGLRLKWRPVAVKERVQSLLRALEVLAEEPGPEFRAQPMFRVAGDGDGRVPVDARVFLRFPDAPEEFLGMQLQVAVNDVQGTKYPYLYAVLVARPGFGLHGERLAGIESAAQGLTVETSREEDVEVVVIRQHTTKKSGYHTSPAAAARIARAAHRAVRGLVRVGKG